jgi:hypothetical protein
MENGLPLKEIRHIVGAHRDHDAARQLEIIEAIDPLSVYRMAVGFYSCVDPLVTFLIKVTMNMADPRTLMKHLVDTPEFQALSKPPMPPPIGET